MFRVCSQTRALLENTAAEGLKRKYYPIGAMKGALALKSCF